MKVPKKISPDRIKAAIIEVRYDLKVPFEIALGMFYNALDETYLYASRPAQNNKIGDITVQPNIIIDSNQNIFFHDKVKIQFQEDRIIFNCIDEYISWGLYKAEIEKTLAQLSLANAIESFIQIGVRYISHYPEIDLNECINFSFSFGMTEIVSDNYSFRSQFHVDELHVNLNLSSKTPLINSFSGGTPIIKPTSIIDIDVIQSNIKIIYSDVTPLVELIDKLHSKEKELFFTLLKTDFLSTLNPEY